MKGRNSSDGKVTTNRQIYAFLNYVNTSALQRNGKWKGKTETQGKMLTWNEGAFLISESGEKKNVVEIRMKCSRIELVKCDLNVFELSTKMLVFELKILN
jgi:hypothetical protein